MAVLTELIGPALMEIGVIGAIDAASAPDATYALTRLNRILDDWNAERAAVYADQYLTYTFDTGGTVPQTLGPSAATYTTTQRPVTIEYANVILTNDVRVPIALWDKQAYDAQTVPSVTATFPLALYYNPSFPNGQLYWWPIPTTAYGLELQVRIVLADLALTDAVTLPPGYKDALIFTLAEALCRPFGRPIPPSLSGDGAKARARIFANNDETPRIATQDAGMPTRVESSTTTTFNYRSGLFGP
jgi:hypothetical protein